VIIDANDHQINAGVTNGYYRI